MSPKRTHVPCPLRSAALEHPEADAVVLTGERISYAELDGRVSAAGKRLAELGVESGGRVALYLAKGVDYLVVLLALMRAGGVACPVSMRLPAGGVGPLLRRTGISALVSSDEGVAGAVGEVRVLR